MEESSFYQSVLAEGMAKGIAQGIAQGMSQGMAKGLAEGEREMLLLIAGRKLGEPDSETRAAISQIDSVPRLQELALRVFDANTWQDLLR